LSGSLASSARPELDEAALKRSPTLLTTRNLCRPGFTDAGDLGVCKGGTDAGEACTEDTDCDGGSCEEGVCTGGGANDGQGCSVANQAVDCPGGACEPCDALAENGFLPVDCTVTYIAPQGVPTMSRWGLIAMAGLLLLTGSLLLQQRRRRARQPHGS